MDVRMNLLVFENNDHLYCRGLVGRLYQILNPVYCLCGGYKNSFVITVQQVSKKWRKKFPRKFFSPENSMLPFDILR